MRMQNTWQLSELDGVEVWSRTASNHDEQSACRLMLLVWQEPTQRDWEWEVMSPEPDMHLTGGRRPTQEEAMRAASEALCANPLTLANPDHLMDSRAWHALLSSSRVAVQ